MCFRLSTMQKNATEDGTDRHDITDQVSTHTL